MTYAQAIAKARMCAIGGNTDMYVMFDDVECDYDIADDFDLDTFYIGQAPIAVIEPDGTCTESTLR